MEVKPSSTFGRLGSDLGTMILEKTPQSQIPLEYSDAPLLLYGAGQYAAVLFRQIEAFGLSVTGFLDSNSARHNTLYLNRPIFPFETDLVNLTKCNIVLAVVDEAHHPQIVDWLNRIGIPRNQIFTDLPFLKKKSLLYLIEPPTLNRHLELYSLSEHLSDEQSVLIFRRRYRHVILNDRPENDLSSDDPVLSFPDAVTITDPSLPIPDTKSVRYLSSRSLFWDLVHRRSALGGKNVLVEFSHSDPFFWRIPFLILGMNSGARLTFRPGHSKRCTLFYGKTHAI